MVYLTQDYEPDLFGGSSDFLSAQSTYAPPTPVFAVINTKILFDYFDDQQHKFDREYYFDPKLNSVLRSKLPEDGRQPPKKKQILIYGRPWHARNAFGLIEGGLREWRSRYPHAQDWEILSAGSTHQDIDLGGGVLIKSVGALPIDEYAQVLRDSSVGVSLMVSPHPSYPPFEMAHFGLWVITNNFANKNLTALHDNFLSPNNCTPSTIADLVITACERVASDSMSGYQGQSRMPSYTDQSPMFPFMEELVADLQPHLT